MSSSSSQEQSDARDMDHQDGVVDEEVDDLANNAFIESLLAEAANAGPVVDPVPGEDDELEGNIQVEIQGDAIDDNAAENHHFSEPHTHIFTFLQNLLLILGFTVIGQRRLMQLIQNSGVERLLRLAGPYDDDSDDDDGDYEEGVDSSPRWRGYRRPKLDPTRFPKVPSVEGGELMSSGVFGSSEAYTVTSNDRGNIRKKKKLAMRILDRELAIESPAKQKLNQRLMAQGMIPASNADMIIHYDEPVYSGQFSDDGNFFFSANKDYRVRMYDTSNPYKWRYYKTVNYPFGQWTLTDASLSPDNKYLAYTSIVSQVCLAPTDPNDTGDPYVLDLAGDQPAPPPAHTFHLRRRGFGIWSIRYSGDGRDLVAGTTGGSIVVYDIEARRVKHRIFGHMDDVNAVCFADKSSPHLLYSGSDDTTLKVWDTRSMGDNRAAGAFIGHIEGLTYIDSKGDGRYILSNGKDQSMKLWDLRMVMPSGEFDRIQPTRRVSRQERFDYRWGTYDDNDWYQDEHDNSVVTFRGHKVLRTLIRCHFSPPASTNSRYVYTGSEDGKVYIYNLDATLAGTVDVKAATKDSRPRWSSRNWDDSDEEEGPIPWRTCVRDASWHPNAPMIVASAWNGYGMQNGTCTAHSWNDGAEDDEAEPKMGMRVNQRLEHDPVYYDETVKPRRGHLVRQARLRALGLRYGGLNDSDDDDED